MAFTGRLRRREGCSGGGAQRGQGGGPGHELVEGGGECGGPVFGGGEVADVGEVGVQAEGDLGGNVGDLQSAEDGAECRDGADAAVEAVRDEAGCLVVPLGVDAVEGVLE